jgi:protein TonB
MNQFNKENSITRWIISGSAALFGMLLFLLLATGFFKDKSLPDLGPLLELDYVTIVEPKIQPKKPPKVTPKKVKQKKITEPMPEPEIIEALPKTPLIETAPLPSEVADLPAHTPPTQSPVKTDQPRRIGSTVELDNVGFEPIYNPKPDYPVVAQESRITGYVDVDLLIDEKGKVKSYSIVTVKGHPSFAKETIKVLPRWRFPPPRIGGKKTSVKYVYRINFRLN